MSRNIGNTCCSECGDEVVLVGETHPITNDEAGVYFGEYAGMLVADAECESCKTRYLAWVKPAPRMSLLFRGPRTGEPFFDLSYRSSFNDEPGEGDIPPKPAAVPLGPSYVEVAISTLRDLATSSTDDRVRLDAAAMLLKHAQGEE